MQAPAVALDRAVDVFQYFAHASRAREAAATRTQCVERR